MSDKGHRLQQLGISRYMQGWLGRAVVRWLPYGVARLANIWRGRLYHRYCSWELDQIDTYQRAVAAWYAAVESPGLLARTAQGLYDHYHEKLFIAFAPFARVCRFLRRRVAVHGEERLRAALERGRGLLLVTAHYGSVEFLPLTLALRGYPVTMVVRFKTERLKRALIARTRLVPITLLDAATDEAIVFKVLQALSQNRVVIVECDEFAAWRPYRDRHFSFLGQQIPVDRTLDLLPRRYRSPVLLGLVQRQRRRFRLAIEELSPAMTANESLGVRALRSLEGHILADPSQWYQWRQLGVVANIPPAEERHPESATAANPAIPAPTSPLHAGQA